MKRLNLLYLAGVLAIATGFFSSPTPGLAAYGDPILPPITAGGLNQPAKVALDSANGDVYVTDAGNKMVKKYDKNGNYIASFTLTVSGTPVGIAVTSTNIFVGDSTNYCVWIYNKTGALTDLLGTGDSHKLGGFFAAKLKMPNTITVGPSGHIFVVDGDSDQVSIFRTDGTLYSTFGVSGTAISAGTAINLYYPSGLAMAGSTASGNQITQYFYLGDQGNFRFQKLYYVYDKYSKDIVTPPTYNAASGSLTIPSTIPPVGSDAFGKFLRVSDLVYDSNRSRLYVVDSLQGVVQQFNDSGVSQVAAFNYSGGATQTYLNVPTGGAINPLTQTLYVANNQGNSIAEFSTQYGTLPTLTVNRPVFGTSSTIRSNPYAVNYTYTAGTSATLYFFYDTDNTWSGGSKSITPGTGEYAIGTVSLAAGGATANYNWQAIRANPGTYYVRGIVVDANGNTAESYSLGTVVIASTPGGLNQLFYSAHPGMTDNPNADDDNDGLTNGQEQTYGTDPLNRDTDGGGISDGVEVAKGGNPLDSSDDMYLAVDKYGIWFTDNLGTISTDPNNQFWTSWYDVKNDSSTTDIVDVTFDEWPGSGPWTARHTTTRFVIPAHGLARFMPRTYCQMTGDPNGPITMGSILIRSINANISGYVETLAEDAVGAGTDEATTLQDNTFATSTALYIPFVDDGQSGLKGLMGLINQSYVTIKNLDKANISNGSCALTIWPNNNSTMTWSRNTPANFTDSFEPGWLTGYTFPYSAGTISRTNNCKIIGYEELWSTYTLDREAFPLPSQGTTTLYIPFYKELCGDAPGYTPAPGDDKWSTYFSLMNVSNVTFNATLTYYDTNGTVLGTFGTSGAPGFVDNRRPSWNVPTAKVGWVKVVASTGLLAGYAEYDYLMRADGSAAGNGTTDGILLSGNTSDRMSMPRFKDNANGYTTRIAVTNTSSSPVTVYADFYDPSGVKSGSTVTHTLGANSVWDFAPRDYNTLTEGSIEFSASAPVLTGMWQIYTTEEPYTDTNANGMWDPGEPYTDTNGNGRYDSRQSCAESLVLK